MIEAARNRLRGRGRRARRRPRRPRPRRRHRRHRLLDRDLPLDRRPRRAVRLAARRAAGRRPPRRPVRRRGQHRRGPRRRPARPATSRPFRPHFDGWRGPWNFATPAGHRAAPRRAPASRDVRCWLAERPVQPDDPREYLRTSTSAPTSSASRSTCTTLPRRRARHPRRAPDDRLRPSEHRRDSRIAEACANRRGPARHPRARDPACSGCDGRSRRGGPSSTG